MHVATRGLRYLTSLSNFLQGNFPHGGRHPPCGKPDLHLPCSLLYLCIVKADFRISVLLSAGFCSCLIARAATGVNRKVNSELASLPHSSVHCFITNNLSALCSVAANTTISANNDTAWGLCMVKPCPRGWL